MVGRALYFFRISLDKARAQFFPPFSLISLIRLFRSSFLPFIDKIYLLPPLSLSLFFPLFLYNIYTYIARYIDRRGNDDSEIGNLDVHFEQRVPDAYYRNIGERIKRLIAVISLIFSTLSRLLFVFALLTPFERKV